MSGEGMAYTTQVLLEKQIAFLCHSRRQAIGSRVFHTVAFHFTTYKNPTVAE